MNEAEFTSKLLSTIDAKFAEIMASKAEGQKFLNYLDAKTISQSIRNVFINRMKSVPNQIEGTLEICEAVMSPTLAEKKEKIKKAGGLFGGIGGIAMIIGGLATAFGWGAGAVAAITAWFTGTAILGPIGWVAGGIGLAAIAGYLAFSGSDPIKNTEGYMNALRSGIRNAMPGVWAEFGDQLSTEETSEK